MISAVIYEVSTGEIVGTYTALYVTEILQQCPDGFAGLIVDPGTDTTDKYVAGDALTNKVDKGETRRVVLVNETVPAIGLPQVPPTFDTSQAGIQTWEFKGQYKGRFILEVISLETARERAWEIVKERRTQRLRGGLVIPGVGTVDTDIRNGVDSLLLIQGGFSAALTAQLQGDTEWSEQWTLEDNTVVTLDIPMMLYVGNAVAKHTANAHKWSRVVSANINAALTLSDIDALAQSPFE